MSTTRSPGPRAPATDPAPAPGPGGPPEWGRAALVLVAHGARKDEGAARTIRSHAENLRDRGLFAAVRACFLRHDPSPERVLAELRTTDIYLMPMLMSGGYILREQIVRRLGLAGPETPLPPMGGSGPRRLLLCPPIGVQPGLPAIVDRRIQAGCDRLGVPAREISVMLIAHGTQRNPASRDAAERCRAALVAKGGYAAVSTAFLEEAPSPGEALRLAPTPRVIAVGLFAADGPHGGSDVKAMLGLPESGATGFQGTADGKRDLFYAGAIGTDDSLPDLILDCVRGFDRALFPAASASRLEAAIYPVTLPDSRFR